MTAARIITAFALALGIAAPAAAETAVSVPRFRSVELSGGGQVVLRHGTAQKVTLVSGSTDVTRFTVERDGRLVIRACVKNCRDYDLRVEIVTPRLDAAAVRGGGEITSAGAFPAQTDLALAVDGGGSIDLQRLPAREVAASVQGGGLIRTRASDELAASVQGGGQITYCGDPSVASAIDGGCSVTRGCSN